MADDRMMIDDDDKKEGGYAWGSSRYIMFVHYYATLSYDDTSTRRMMSRGQLPTTN